MHNLEMSNNKNKVIIIIVIMMILINFYLNHLKYMKMLIIMKISEIIKTKTFSQKIYLQKDNFFLILKLPELTFICKFLNKQDN